MLFERDIPFRHDWEAVLTPVVDVLVDRADVDASALLAYAISQGGYWLPRALAFEHRFVAAVADGGVVDVARAWNVNLPPALLALLRRGTGTGSTPRSARVRRDPAREREFAFRAKPYGGATPFDTFAAAQRYHAARRHRLDHDAAADHSTPRTSSSSRASRRSSTTCCPARRRSCGSPGSRAPTSTASRSPGD